MENPNYKVALGLMLQSMAVAYEDNKHTNHQIVLTLGPTPPVLITLGLPQLPLVMTGKVVDKSFFDHGVTKGILEKAYQIIVAPKAVYKSQTYNGHIVMSYETKGADPLIIAIHPNKQLGRGTVFNVVASIYFKENDPETRWGKDGLLLWKPT